MQFIVKATTKEGDTYEETIEAADRFAVYAAIRQRGDRVIAVKDMKAGGFFGRLFADFDPNALFQGVSMDEKIVVTRNLAAMLEAGLSVSRALSVLERQTKNARLKKVFSAVSVEISHGATLSAGFAKFPGVFSSLLIAMVRAGEESGNVALSLRTVSTQMEKAHLLVKRIKGALMYPSIVLIAMVGIGVLMLIYVVPTLTATFKELGTELPPTTQFIIAASDFLVKNTIVALGLGAAAVFGFLSALRTRPGRRVMDWVLLHTPVISPLVQETNAARTARTLSSLLSSGVDVILALSITRDVLQNHFYQQVLAEAETAVTKGEPFSQAFAKHEKLYPPLVGEMIAVGEETGRLSEMLVEVADFYEGEVEQKTKDLSTIIEPFLMIFIGGAVGFFAISMIAPIYSLSDSI
jgi:type IV pilus assembly protein PilC